MKWEEKLKELVREKGLCWHKGDRVHVTKFISREIIEKLIEDIPDDLCDINSDCCDADCYIPVKQQLRDKWL